MNIAEAFTVIRRHTATAPVDVLAIAREMSLPIVYEHLPEDVSGAIRASNSAPNGYEISVNADHPLTRQRFTIAHELGHFIYHRDLLGRGTGDTRAYRAEPGTGLPNPHITWVQERQANAFAANTLMPAALVEQYRRLGAGTAVKLAAIFKVSDQAMQIRLNTLGK